MSHWLADIIEKVISSEVSLDNEDVLDFISVFDCKKAVNEANVT